VFLVIALSVAGRIGLLLARPLWFDELFTIWAARLPVATLIAMLENDSGPPLFYVLEKPFVYAGERFFSSDVAARALAFAATIALFAGALALPAGPSRRRFLLLSGASPLLLLYAAEARAYALLALLGLALFLLALVFSERPRLSAALFVLTAAILYTHYLGIFVVGAVLIVAAAERRRQSALALLAGASLFAFWVPIMARQPREAVAWMHEPASELVTGILSSLGGAGDIPHPFGPPLPTALVAAGIALTLVLCVALSRRWHADVEVRRGSAFLVLFFGGVVFASIARPVAFAGRTEMAILPVWMWMVARSAEKSRTARIASLIAIAVAVASSAILLAAPREPSPSARALDFIEQTAGPGDVLFAGAHFYLPARLAADRGRLRIPVHAFPVDQAAHTGWSASVRIRPEDVAAVEAVLARAAPASRVYFELPPSYAAALRGFLVARGVVQEIVRTPEVVLLSWSRAGSSASEGTVPHVSHLKSEPSDRHHPRGVWVRMDRPLQLKALGGVPQRSRRAVQAEDGGRKEGRKSDRPDEVLRGVGREKDDEAEGENEARADEMAPAGRPDDPGDGEPEDKREHEARAVAERDESLQPSGARRPAVDAGRVKEDVADDRSPRRREGQKRDEEHCVGNGHLHVG
jgi:hypothetical protein